MANDDIWFSFIGIYYIEVKRGNRYVLSDMEPIYESKSDASIRIFFLTFLFLSFFMMHVSVCENAHFVICSHYSFVLLK